MSTPTLKKFTKSKIMVTDRQEIAKWISKLSDENIEPVEPKIAALHIYEESYYIEERTDGTFEMTIENMFYRETLADCEKILHEWAYGTTLQD